MTNLTNSWVQSGWVGSSGWKKGLGGVDLKKKFKFGFTKKLDFIDLDEPNLIPIMVWVLRRLVCPLGQEGGSNLFRVSGFIWPNYLKLYNHN